MTGELESHLDEGGVHRITSRECTPDLPHEGGCEGDVQKSMTQRARQKQGGACGLQEGGVEGGRADAVAQRRRGECDGVVRRFRGGQRSTVDV